MFDVIHSEDAPAAVGPYAQAIVDRQTVYLSGQIGLVPDEGRLVDDTLEGQARQAMQNIEAVLKAAQCGVGEIVKVTIYLVEMEDFQVLNAIYADWLGHHRPARSTVAVAALPLGARVELDVIARLPNQAS